MPDSQTITQPTFPHRAYGVDLTWYGEEGGMAARGHVPDLRFAAACNHLARTEASLVNVFDDPKASLDDFLCHVRREWAVPVEPEGDDEWRVRTWGITERTPGAIRITTWDPS
jgi:hypothetical protein